MKELSDNQNGKFREKFGIDKGEIPEGIFK